MFSTFVPSAYHSGALSVAKLKGTLLRPDKLLTPCHSGKWQLPLKKGKKD
jgi:hypothetical protein